MKKLLCLILVLVCGHLSSQSLLYSEPFTSALNTATAANGSNGNWIWSNSCTQSSAGGHTAPGHALFQGSGCQFGNGGNTVSGDLHTPTVTLPALGGTLTFNYFLNTECGSPGFSCFYDVLSVGISTNNGVSYTTVLASSGTPTGLTHTNAWVPVTYNLGAYGGQTIKVRFNFNSIDGIGNAYDGVYVDDISIIGACFINIGAVSGGNTVIPIMCSGNSLTITTNAVSNYSWSTGANTASIVVSPTVNTSYTLTATSVSNCVASSVINVTVNAVVPSLSVANTASIALGTCPGSSVMLTASGAITYTWTGGITNGVVFTPTTSTVYTISGTNGCGTTTAAISISIHPTPTVTAVISQPTICTGNTLTTLASGAITYTWSHGAANGAFVYPSSTTIYTVTGSSALGCTASAMVGVTVAITPILAPVATPTIICIGGSGTLAASGASVYNWMPGNLNTGTIVITPNVTTTYTLTKSNSNCVDVKTITVVVNQLPNVFAITSHSVVCAGSSATLSGGGANSYTWTPSSFNLVGANVAVTPTAATIYTCTGSDGTCVATYTVLVGTNPVPTLQATASTPSICQGGSVTLSATGAIAYTWTPGGTGASIVVTPAIPTSYLLVGVNSFSCTSQIQQIVIVYPNPTVNAVPNRTLVCLNGPSTITATGANTYVWSTGALTHTTLVFPPATTVYTVTGTYTNSGCSSSKTVMVQAYTPVTGINGPTAVCIGSSITISSAPANSYTWTLGGNLLSNQASIVIGPTLNTTYMLGTTSTSNNVSCVGGNSITIQVNPLPVVTASAIANRTLICKGESADLTATGGISYNWLFVGQGSMVTVSPQNHTTYTVQGTDANGCMNTATIQVRVSACIGIEEMNTTANNISIYPNPNNGEFNISSKENVNLQLINELGQVVMELKLNEVNQRTAYIKGLANGAYYLRGETRSSKVIVQKN
jgi:hypothetical protein